MRLNGKPVKTVWGGPWGAQSVKHPTSAQVMVSRVCGFEPQVGLCAESQEPASDSLFLSLSLPLPHLRPPSRALSLSQNKLK